jgi:NADH:ubiquinone oxidoreductase subunit C
MGVAEQVKEKLAGKIVEWYQHSPRRIYFKVEPKDIIEVVRVLFRDLGCRLCTATGLQVPEGFEILYHFSHDQTGIIFSPRILIKDKNNPEVESITPIIKGAEWIEREIWELLGINFSHHPKLEHLLLAEDWPEGDYPLRQKSS